ncbi:hypothetical protein AciX8_4441 [Granulicella mallensis MP5ACTX8]|uniref:Uncharacterized protein n=1 Tax=Granulicella mallensis (strain ATCC BAA-1857 / DSM 23137 / MP5ACTX8) TaxID=682795 RepID=G8NU79_GRAMM|nr:hypothetical protein AciX8_4441 [Granulicella mallensis MP5ACTX8]
MTNQKSKDNNNGKGKDNSRFPAGMTSQKSKGNSKSVLGRYLFDSMLVPPLAYIA